MKDAVIILIKRGCVFLEFAWEVVLGFLSLSSYQRSGQPDASIAGHTKLQARFCASWLLGVHAQLLDCVCVLNASMQNRGPCSYVAAYLLYSLTLVWSCWSCHG